MTKIKGLTKHNLDFLILDCLNNNIKDIVIKDNSEYGWALERLYIEILFLGYQELKTAIFILNEVNVFNSTKLGLSNNISNELVNIEDGLYWISYCVNLHNFYRCTKLYLRTIMFDCTYDNLLLKLSFDNCSVKEDSELKKQLLELDLMREASLANINYGNIDKGIEIFKKANKELKKLENKLEKNCN